MVDYQRQLLDELMGRNRNLDPGQKAKEKTWKDPDNCKFFMVTLSFYEIIDRHKCSRVHCYIYYFEVMNVMGAVVVLILHATSGRLKISPTIWP